MLLQTSHKTPVGNLFLISDEHILLAAGFRSFEDLVERMDVIDVTRERKSVRNIPIISDLVKDYFDIPFHHMKLLYLILILQLDNYI